MDNDKFPHGWIDPNHRTAAGHLSHQAATAKMPFFSLPPMGKPEVGFKILLTDLWSHSKVVAVFGGAYTGVHQITGSCVGAGGGNALFTVNAIETIRGGENERLMYPFWLFNYGRSRTLAGMRGQGEGSFGSTFAQSCTEDGTPDSMLTDLALPQPTKEDGWIWGKQVEMRYSDSRTASAALASESKKHLIGTTSELRSGEQVRDAIINGYPVTRAFSKFVNPGSQSVRNGATIGSYNGYGGHQETWLGYWNHPYEGELIWEQNQWGLNTYGVDPGGGPLGGCWIRLADVDRECAGQNSEIYAFSQYDGYPRQPDVFDWSKQSFFS